MAAGAAGAAAGATCGRGAGSRGCSASAAGGGATGARAAAAVAWSRDRAGAAGRARLGGQGERRLEQGELELQTEATGAETRRVDAGQATGRRGDPGLGGAAGCQVREQLLAQRVDHLVQEHAQVPAAFLEAVEEDNARRGVPAGERGDEPVHQLGVGQSQEVPYGVGLDAACRRAEQLVEDGLRVAHAPCGQAGDHADRVRIRLAAVGRQDALELAGDLRDGETPDVEPLEPRQDGRREVLRVGRREHERHEVGRLLERLEEGVPGVLRDLVGLVEDVDLAPEVGGGVAQALAQLADIVDAAIGRGVDLDQVQGPALADGVARVTRVAGIGVGSEVLAVERLGEDPRERRLAGATRSSEQDRVRHLARGHGIAQRGDDRLLADDLGERLGAPSAVEGLVGGPLGQLQLLDAPAAGRGRVGSAVHPPSMRTSPRPAAHAARTRPFRGTRQSALSAASFRT